MRVPILRVIALLEQDPEEVLMSEGKEGRWEQDMISLRETYASDN